MILCLLTTSWLKEIFVEIDTAVKISFKEMVRASLCVFLTRNLLYKQGSLFFETLLSLPRASVPKLLEQDISFVTSGLLREFSSNLNRQFPVFITVDLHLASA